jgi:predicted DCC family thiol-disulfide oxidoreductase YuxK
MKKISNVCIVMLFVSFLTTGVLTCGWKCSEALCEDIEVLHEDKSSPTQGLMRIISSHTSKMLDAIMIGDFDAVLKESVEIINASDVVMRMFFSADGKAGEWFSKAGNDPDDPKAVIAMKEEFEKYLKQVTDASRNVAETSKSKNIVETYNSFDSMLRKACFKCHQTSRLEWPGWMTQVEVEEK